MNQTKEHGNAFREYLMIYSCLIYLGNKSEEPKQVKTMTKINKPISHLDQLLFIKNQIIMPVTAMIYVGDSDPELNNTRNNKVEAKIII